MINIYLNLEIYVILNVQKKSKKTKDNYCEALCNETNPFVIIETEECVDFCDFNLISTGLCVYKYNNEIEQRSDENINEVNKGEKRFRK